VRKLSDAQVRFLRRCHDCGEDGFRTPFIGGRQAGRVAAGWYRTADSLSELGLVDLRRWGDARVAKLTVDGENAVACLT